jgi:hypothetical protein
VTDEHRELPAHRLWQPTTAKWFFAIFGFALVYAVIRYHFAGDVPWRHFPLFILNKATSLGGRLFRGLLVPDRKDHPLARPRQGATAGGHQVLRLDGGYRR